LNDIVELEIQHRTELDGGRRGRDLIVSGFTTIYTISVYNH